MQQQQQQQVCLRFIKQPECIQAFSIHGVGSMHILSAIYFVYEHNVFLCLVYAVPAAVLPAGPGPVSEWSTGRVLRIFCADPEL